MANPFAHIELTTSDLAAAKKFYKKLFDWKLTDMEAMPYTGIETGGQGIPGGIGQAEGHEGRVTFYVEVDDVAAGLAKANSLGGSTVMEPIDIPSGQIGLFADPEGQVIGLMNMNGSV